MERNVLVNEIIKICFEYGVINKDENEDEIKSVIYHRLDEEEFIENLINAIITKTRIRNDIDTGKLIEVLTELEKIRLELEYKNHSII